MCVPTYSKQLIKYIYIFQSQIRMRRKYKHWLRIYLILYDISLPKTP